MEPSHVLQVWRPAEEKLESEEKLPGSYFYQAYFSSPWVVESSPPDGRKREGRSKTTERRNGRSASLHGQYSLILSCQSLIPMYRETSTSHFEVPKLEDFSDYLTFFFLFLQYKRQNQDQSCKVGLQYLEGKGDMHKHIFFIKRFDCIYLYKNGLSETAGSH